MQVRQTIKQTRQASREREREPKRGREKQKGGKQTGCQRGETDGLTAWQVTIRISGGRNNTRTCHRGSQTFAQVREIFQQN